MKLHVGERLHGTGPSQQPGGYLVTDVVRETPWYGLYTGKKILYNFDFAGKRIRETDDKEWLDVYLRTLHYPRLDDPADVAQRRALARSEVRILGNRGSNLWPEPIDLLEIENTRDTFAFPPADDQREPIVVFARPHGLPLGDWQQSAMPVSSLLSVLAELLEFLRQAHAEGLLLQGLGPAAILIDRADRVHYIGSDMVAELKELSKFRGLFPAERYPRGFAPPEYVDGAASVSPRSDLYAWGTLAYFLFTGHMPWQIALEQGRPWAQFQDAHFERLERALRQIPPAHVSAWAEQLGLPGSSLLEGWPGNCVAMMRWLLHPEPARRPSSAEEVRAWMVALPPAQVNAVLALETDGGEARVYVDMQHLDAGAEIEVRRALGQAPLEPDQGTLAYSGPAVPVLVDTQAPLTEEPYYYTVFSRKTSAAGALYSGGVAARIVEPSAADLLDLADAEATAAANDAIPPRMALCFRAMDTLPLAETLLQSPRPRVRGWAWQRLAELAGQKSSDAATQLRRGLQDAEPALRLQTARVIWRLNPDHSDAALLALVQEMGAKDLDRAIHAAHSLRDHDIPDDQLQRIIERLEGERPTSCPLCKVPLPRRAWADHLRSVHDYLEVDGGMMPRAQAEPRLWERVFASGDNAAHRQLLKLYLGDGANNGAADGYVAALEQQMERRPDFPGPLDGSTGSDSAKRWQGCLACLRQAGENRPIVERLLRSSTERVRTVGRTIVLGSLAERLRTGSPDVAELRRVLQEAMPGPDLLEHCIAVCRHLPKVGVDPGLAGACETLLREDLPVRCTECTSVVRAADFELHLRRAHGVFEFRGVRRSYAETRDFLVAAVCGSRPDPQAWNALVGLAQDRHGPAANERLATWLCRSLKLLERPQRNFIVGVVADVIARSDAALTFIALLLGDAMPAAWKNLARHLALEIVARRQQLLPDDLLACVKPYLAAKDVPSEARQHAVAGLLRCPDLSTEQASAILQAYVSATSRNRAVDRLHALEEQIGQSPVIEAFLIALEDRIRMTCPRCQVELERRDMVGHLWDKHRLVLEGRRVREPWRVLADWVVDYRLEKDPALLQRCRELALKSDPAEGGTRLQRLLLSQGVEDRAAWDAVVARARQRGASVCPYCYAQVPVASVMPPLPLAGGDRLEGHGFSIQLDDGSMTPHLRVEGPTGTLHDAREPGAGLTRLGTLVVLAGPVVLAAYGLLYALLGPDLPWLPLLLLAIGLSLFLGGLLYLVWPQRSLRVRLLEAGWHLLVPELLTQPLTEEAANFIGSLAATSVGQFLPEEEVLDAALEAVEGRSEAALLPLWRLQEHAAEEHGHDSVTLVSERVVQALAGQRSLRLVGPWLGELRERWPKGRWARLQAVICARAAEAGLDTADLSDLVRVQPALASAVGGADFDRVLQLQHLWTLQRRNEAWPQPAETIFELANDPATERALADRPDLLLRSKNGPIHVGTRGVWLKDACITEQPAQVDVVSTRWQNGEGFEIVAGPHRVLFASNPNALADELEQWLRFYFVDFLPHVNRQPARRGGEASRRLWRANAASCPECHRQVVPIAGEMGLRIADTEVQLAS